LPAYPALLLMPVTTRQPLSRFAATFESDLHQRPVKTRGDPPPPPRQVRELSGKDAATAIGIVAEESPGREPKDHRCAAPGQISHDTDISAMHTARRRLTDRATCRLQIALKFHLDLGWRDAHRLHHDTIGGRKQLIEMQKRELRSTRSNGG